MKLLVILTVAALLSGANANSIGDFFGNLFHSIGNTLHTVTEQVKPLAAQLGQSILTTLKTQGTQLLGGVVESLTGALSSSSGKRDLSEIASFLATGKHVIDRMATNLSNFFQHAMGKLANIADKIHSFEFLKEPLENILSEIKNVVNLHGHLQLANIAELLKNPSEFLVKLGGKFLGGLMHKRNAIVDGLKSVGQSLLDMFKPLIDQVHQHVTTLAGTLTSAATGIASAIKPHIDALKSQLSQHLNTLKQVGSTLLEHGKNAVSALGSAVTDILGQTATNAAPAIHQLLETGKSAAGVIGDHLIQALG